ncbi:hypothetical protein ACWDRB_46965 [Nonomuraea sp. NPDC003707]
MTFFRPISSSSALKAFSTGAPSGLAPKSTTWVSSDRNGRTVEKRPPADAKVGGGPGSTDEVSVGYSRDLQ